MEGPRQAPAGIFSRNVSRTIFTHLECAKHSPGQVRTALLLRLVRTPGTHCRGRTGSKSAPRFAPYYPRLARTWAAVTSAVTTKSYQFGRLPNVRLPHWLPPKADPLRSP